MSTELIRLRDKIITDRGEVVHTYDNLLHMALMGEEIVGMLSEQHPDIDLFNKRNGYDPNLVIHTWADDGVLAGPDVETYVWNIPDEYKQLDIEELLIQRLIERGFADNPNYTERLAQEIFMMSERDMYPFVQCLVWIIDEFRKNKVVWGVGRGSSCASLAMFLLDINRIDPVKYDIPITEFLKENAVDK